MRAVGFSLLHCNNEGIPKLEQNKTLVRSCSFLSPCVGSLLCSCVSLSEEFRSQGCCLMPVRMLLRISSFFFSISLDPVEIRRKRRGNRSVYSRSNQRLFDFGICDSRYFWNYLEFSKVIKVVNFKEIILKDDLISFWRECNFSFVPQFLNFKLSVTKCYREYSRPIFLLHFLQR